jgi:muramoyltetrapeptide carboxypeptidase LdcA involved in peptidoglycan recycling
MNYIITNGTLLLPDGESLKTEKTDLYIKDGVIAAVGGTVPEDFGDYETVDASGRLLGGCLDCICDVLGTRYDKTADFIKRYKNDGIIWYFDIFAMKAEAVHNTLFKMKDMGYFENARAFVFGRVCFPSSFSGLSYIDAAKKILGDAPLIFDADVGHVPPKMTLINGSVARVTAKDGKGSLEMFLA